jgi:hypothetical protein
LKKSFLFILFIISTLSFASTSPCKIEAQTAAFTEFKTKNPDVSVFLREKFKPIANDKVIYHMVEISDLENGQKFNITVTMNLKDCSVQSID